MQKLRSLVALAAVLAASAFGVACTDQHEPLSPGPARRALVTDSTTIQKPSPTSGATTECVCRDGGGVVSSGNKDCPCS